VETCPTCNGLGHIYSKKCHKCGGDGRVREQQQVRIDIPAGIAEGQTISLSNQGEAGERGGSIGDLYVTIRIKSHSKFERKGNDIFSTEHISFSQAVMGDKIEVQTIEKKMLMKIPSGTQSGEIFRIKGQGVPHLNRSGARGDQLIKIVVDIPKNPNREQRRIIEELGKIGL
jgi:molecular chaperone DnaJ